MKLRKVNFFFILFLLSAGFRLPGHCLQNSAAGNVDFINVHNGQILVSVTDESSLYSLAVGDFVHVLAGNREIHFIITEKTGHYFRCRLYKAEGNILRTVTEGQKVYNSPALNNKRKYYDLRNTMSELAGIYEKFIYGIGTSENPQVIADEINRFSDKLEKIIPVIEHIYGQYPELKNIKSVPDELREVFSRMKKLESLLGEAFYKIRLYGENGDIKKAAARLDILIRRITGKK